MYSAGYHIVFMYSAGVSVSLVLLAFGWIHTSKLQNIRPFFNTKSSFSGAILHYLCIFTKQFPKQLAFLLQFGTIIIEGLLIIIIPRHHRVCHPVHEECKHRHRHSSNCNNKWPLFNTNPSFFRGDSPFFLHFQSRKKKKLAFILEFAVLIPILPLSNSEP